MAALPQAQAQSHHLQPEALSPCPPDPKGCSSTHNQRRMDIRPPARSPAPSPGATPDPGRCLLTTRRGSPSLMVHPPEPRRSAETWCGRGRGWRKGRGARGRNSMGPQAAPGGGTQAQRGAGAGARTWGARGRPRPTPVPAAAVQPLTCSGSASPSAGGTRSAPPPRLSKPTAFSVKTMQRACAARARPRPSGLPPRGAHPRPSPRRPRPPVPPRPRPQLAPHGEGRPPCTKQPASAPRDECRPQTQPCQGHTPGEPPLPLPHHLYIACTSFVPIPETARSSTCTPIPHSQSPHRLLLPYELLALRAPCATLNWAPRPRPRWSQQVLSVA